MKKLLTGILALLMSFGCLVACNVTEDDSSTPASSNTASDSNSEETPALTHAADLRDVKTAFLMPIASEASSSNKTYTVRNKFSFDGESDIYTINWSVTDANGNAVEGVTLQKGTGDTDAVIISVTEDTAYVLSATITCPDGCCTSEAYSTNRTALASAEVPVAITEAPQENVAYKLYVYQSAISTDCYMTGEEKPNYPWYLLSDPDYANAIDLYIKNVTGGFNIYAEVDGETKYLSIVKTGGHTSSFFMTVAELQEQEDCENAVQSVWTWDGGEDGMGTVVTMLDNDKCYMGCNGTFDTISAQYKEASNIYKGVLCEMKAAGSVVIEDTEKVTTTLNELSVVEKITQDKSNIVLATQGSKYAEVSVTWTEDSEYATITSNILDLVVPTEEATVTLTATVKCGDVTETKTLTITLGPKTVEVADKTDAAAILAEANKLAKDEELPGGPYTLTGQVVSVDEAYSEKYSNITVSISVNDTTLKCYRLKGEEGINVSGLKMGDIITVSGTIMNYNGKVQFASGCKASAITEGEIGGDTDMTPAEIVDAAYALAPGATLGLQTLTGVVTEITEAYSTQYKNVGFIIVVENKTDKPILCFRTKGDDAASVKVGDTVTVTGELMNYLSSSAEEGDPGKVEFSMGTITALVAGSGNEGDGEEGETPAPTPAEEVSIPEALALADGTALVVSGTVCTIDQAYNSNYNNITIYITDDNGNKLYVFRLTGNVEVGQIIKVTGTMGSYNGSKQVAQGATFEVVGTCAHANYTDATCTEPAACVICGTAKDNVTLPHNYVQGVCDACGALESNEGVKTTTASKTMAELITANGWTTSTTKQSFTLDDVVSVKVDGGSNTGKAYNGDHIRIYATDSPAGTLTISLAEGYELVSIKVTTATGTYAFLCVGDSTEDISNATTAVSGSSVVLNSVKNGDNGKQVRIIAMEVEYKAV